MNTPTLKPEQIKAWRMVIAMQLNSMSPGAGIYAHIMPESEVIAYWQKMKAVLERPKLALAEDRHVPNHEPIKPKGCNHSNHITGQNGKYCVDCEKYL